MADINKYGAPTVNTIGTVGQRYLDLATGTRYICSDVKDIWEKVTSKTHPHDFVSITKEKFRREYIWEAVGGGGSVTEDEQIEMLIKTDLLPAVTTASGAILTDNNGNVILRY